MVKISFNFSEKPTIVCFVCECNDHLIMLANTKPKAKMSKKKKVVKKKYTKWGSIYIAQRSKREYIFQQIC